MDFVPETEPVKVGMGPNGFYEYHNPDGTGPSRTFKEWVEHKEMDRSKRDHEVNIFYQQTGVTSVYLLHRGLPLFWAASDVLDGVYFPDLITRKFRTEIPDLVRRLNDETSQFTKLEFGLLVLFFLLDIIPGVKWYLANKFSALREIAGVWSIPGPAQRETFKYHLAVTQEDFDAFS